MNREHLLETWVLALICFCLTACSKHIIWLEDDLLASKDGTENVSNSLVTRFENPLFSGLVTARGLRLGNDSRGRPTTCCRRLLMRADNDVFALPNLRRSRSGFLSITREAVETYRGKPVFPYEVPPVSMPTDGATVRLSLFENRDLIAGSVRLSERVIVIPVHIHVFTAHGRDVPSDIKRETVFTWFERPTFTTEAQTIHGVSTRSTETHIVTNEIFNQIYSNADDVWHQADIQFRLQSYDVIENTEFERQVVSGNIRRFIPSEVHRRYSNIPGLHIYVGRNGDNVSPGGLATIQGQTRGPGCGSNVRRNNAIALAWDEARSGGGISNALAHEIGHFLGLEHTNDGFDRSCGNQLLDDPDASNLMETFANVINITPRQANRARTIACQYLRLWGISSRSCR